MLVVTLMLSPWHNSCLMRPSKLTQAVLRLSGETEIFNSTPAGTTMGLEKILCYLNYSISVLYLKERLCGHIGVTMTAGTLG